MKSENQLPLVALAMARPFAEALEKAGHPAKAFLERAHLPPNKLYDDDVFVPAQAWYDFVEAAAKAASDPEFGFNVGANTPMARLPNVKILRLKNATVGELLTALVIDAQRLTTLATYSLTITGQNTILKGARSFVPTSQPAQMDGYFAGFILRILRTCVGPHYKSTAISIKLCEPKAIPQRALPRKALRKGGTEGVTITMPSRWMLLSADGAMRQEQTDTRPPSTAYLSAFRQIVELHLANPKLNMETVAKLTSRSPRSMQWALVSSGTSFTCELTSVRREAAIHLLLTTNRSIAEIGARVGYADHASFARAFKRWTKLSPREFRRRTRSFELDK